MCNPKWECPLIYVIPDKQRYICIISITSSCIYITCDSNNYGYNTKETYDAVLWVTDVEWKEKEEKLKNPRVI